MSGYHLASTIKKAASIAAGTFLLAASAGALAQQDTPATPSEGPRGARGARGARAATAPAPGTGAQAPAEGGRWRRSPSTWYNEISAPTPPDRWPGSIIEFIRDMEKTPPPQEAVLFAGSATIAIWPTEKNFPQYKTIRRGFGGSNISDSTFFADRLIVPAKPSTIVMYAGDNDVTGGKSPYLTALAFEEFLWKINFELPNTQVIFISIRPSISRWNIVETFREANKLIQDVIAKYDFAHYVDIDKVTIGPDGMPRADFFQADDLHLTDLGYAEWSKAVDPVLAKAEARYKELKAANPVNEPRLRPARGGRGGAGARGSRGRGSQAAPTAGATAPAATGAEPQGQLNPAGNQ